MKTTKHDKLMNTKKKETKPYSAATSGRMQRLVRSDFWDEFIPLMMLTVGSLVVIVTLMFKIFKGRWPF